MEGSGHPMASNNHCRPRRGRSPCNPGEEPGVSLGFTVFSLGFRQTLNPKPGADRVEVLPLDVADDASVQAAAEEVKQKYGAESSLHLTGA